VQSAGLVADAQITGGRAADPQRCPAAIVTAQDPAAGDAEMRGTHVVLTVASCDSDVTPAS
jgi:hypothetical protein